MNILRLLLMIGLLLVAPFTNIHAEAYNTPSAMIQVDGLSCPFCAYGLEKHLKKIDGVENVKIYMKDGNATVTLKPGATVDDSTLIEAVKKAGFTARGITRQ